MSMTTSNDMERGFRPTIDECHPEPQSPTTSASSPISSPLRTVFSSDERARGTSCSSLESIDLNETEISQPSTLVCESGTGKTRRSSSGRTSSPSSLPTPKAYEESITHRQTACCACHRPQCHHNFESHSCTTDRQTLHEHPKAPERSATWLTISAHLPPWTVQTIEVISNKLTVQIVYGVVTLAVATFSAAAAAYFAFKAYHLQVWQAEKDFYDWCSSVTEQSPQFDECSRLLKTKLPVPPYAYSRTPEDAAKVARRDPALSHMREPIPVFNKTSVVVILLIALSLVAVQVIFAFVLRPAVSRVEMESKRLRFSLRTLHNPCSPNAFPHTMVRAEPLYRPPNLSFSPEADALASQHPKISPLAIMHQDSSDRHDQQRVRPDKEEANYTKITQSSSVDSQPETRSILRDVSPVRRYAILEDDEDGGQITSTLPASEETVRRTQDQQESRLAPTDLSKKHHRSHRSSDGVSASDSVNGEAKAIFLKHSLSQRQSSSLSSVSSTDDISEAAAGPEDVYPRHIAQGLVNIGKFLASTSSGVIGKQMVADMTEDRSELLYNILSSGVPMVKSRRDSRYDEQKDRFIYGSVSLPSGPGAGVASNSSHADAARTRFRRRHKSTI